MTYELRIVTYKRDQSGHYTVDCYYAPCDHVLHDARHKDVPFNPHASEGEAIEYANRLKRITGKAYAIFEGSRRVHETSQYFASLSLPRIEDAS